MNHQAIAKQFLQQYYSTLMSGRKGRQGLINFYSNVSIMTYGGQTFRGIKQISEKIQSFSFEQIQYNLDQQDIQEGPINGSLLIFVSGNLLMDNENQFKFSQVFNICPNGNGGLYCHNDIFTVVM